jgi:purine-binding chemotaxis protein CheW
MTDTPNQVLGSTAPKLVVFALAGQRYAIHVTAVERVLPMVAISRLPKAPAIVLGVINLHGIVVPVVDLRRRLGVAPCEYGVTAHLLVARTSRWRMAMAVDEVLGVREIAATAVVRPDVVLPGTAHVAGIATLPDGLLLIHDLDTFLSLHEEQHLIEALEEMTE